MKELLILSPDGQSRLVPLDKDRISLGRAGGTELCYPEDNGLSRQHLAVERDGDGWALRDLGSKNGTMLNGARITARVPLKSGDRIVAGQLVLIYDNPASQARRPVVVFDSTGGEGVAPVSSSTTITRLDGVIGDGNRPNPPETLAANHVSALIRAGNELAGNRPLPELFRFILDLSIQAVQGRRGVLMTVEGGELVVQANRGDGFRISTAVRDRVLNGGVSILVRDAAMDDAYRERRSIVGQNIRTLIAVPLQTRDRIIGIIYVDSPSVIREFTKDDLNLLTVMANVAAVRIENARLAELEREEQLLARDLQQAAEIQRGLLPSAPPAVRGLDLAGYNAPCRTVGGDYYDFFPYGPGRIAMAVGDVSGKGMPASLLMMGLQARVQVLIEEPKSLAEVMTRLNRITSTNCPANRFISLFFCLLDGNTGDLTFANAGHNPPLILRANGENEQLSGSGPVLGITPSTEYREHRSHLDEGDTLLIYSDGITEAINSAGVEFGVGGLARVASGRRTDSAATIVSEVNQALLAWTGGAPPADDITLIVARRVVAWAGR
jgi:phosphoserine phosphatase RsbU/P